MNSNAWGGRLKVKHLGIVKEDTLELESCVIRFFLHDGDADTMDIYVDEQFADALRENPEEADRLTHRLCEGLRLVLNRARGVQ